jgi:hypothetical protein
MTKYRDLTEIKKLKLAAGRSFLPCENAWHICLLSRPYREKPLAVRGAVTIQFEFALGSTSLHARLFSLCADICAPAFFSISPQREQVARRWFLCSRGGPLSATAMAATARKIGNNSKK